MSDQFELIFLGTGAAVPSKRRGLPCFAIIKGANIILCDCGEGSQMRIMEAGIRPSKIRHIFISHLHGDHVFGLPGFLTTQQMMSRKQPLSIWGPLGLKAYLQNIQNISGFRIQFPLFINEMGSNVEMLDIGIFKVKAMQLEHGPTVCYGYRFIEPNKRGPFNNNKAEALRIPSGPLRSKLANGQSILLPNGEKITPDQVLGAEQPGRILAFCTDTRPCQACMELADCCDFLVHDSTFLDIHSDWAKETGHSTSREAGRVALTSHSRRLALWHISSRYDDELENSMLLQAKEVFSESILVSDFQTVDLQRRK